MPNLTESSAEEDEETNLATELQKKFHYFEVIIRPSLAYTTCTSASYTKPCMISKTL